MNQSINHDSAGTRQKLTAEEIHNLTLLSTECRNSPDHNRQAIEDLYREQTPAEIFRRALQRADRWPWEGKAPGSRYGLQYAYLLEFLITEESREVQGG